MKRWILCAMLLAGCGTDGEQSPTPTASPVAAGDPFAVAIVAFEPGEGAGFGQDLLPDIVLGPPEGGGERTGTLDVLSLGAGGSIILELGQRAVDGDGPDLIVFENAFRYGDAPELLWIELAQVAVSDDGESWAEMPCDQAGYPWAGCVGVQPSLANSDNGIDPTDPTVAGGDAVDLAHLGVASARYVRITDLSESGAGPSAGFDLDAISVVNGLP